MLLLYTSLRVNSFIGWFFIWPWILNYCLNELIIPLWIFGGTLASYTENEAPSSFSNLLPKKKFNLFAKAKKTKLPSDNLKYKSHMNMLTHISEKARLNYYRERSALYGLIYVSLKSGTGWENGTGVKGLFFTFGPQLNSYASLPFLNNLRLTH